MPSLSPTLECSATTLTILIVFKQALLRLNVDLIVPSGPKCSRGSNSMTLSEQVSRTEPVKQIASKVVNECLKVKPDEQVNIFTFPHTLDYGDALALEVEKAGGVS